MEEILTGRFSLQKNQVRDAVKFWTEVCDDSCDFHVDPKTGTARISREITTDELTTGVVNDFPVVGENKAKVKMREQIRAAKAHYEENNF